MARVYKGVFRIREDFGDRFVEVRCGRVGKVGTTDTICKNGVTDKKVGGRVKTDGTGGVARGRDDFDRVFAKPKLFWKWNCGRLLESRGLLQYFVIRNDVTFGPVTGGLARILVKEVVLGV